MIGRNNSSLIGLVHVGRVIMIIFLTMSSCQRQVSCHKDGIEIIDILNKDCPIQIDLYDIVDSIKYIPLETSECLLSDIECIKNDGNFYFVKDSRGLFVFDEEGHFINEISHRGIGPDEYVYSDNFYLDRDNKLVCLICNSARKILQYSYIGTYSNTIQLNAKDANIESAMMCGEGELIAYYPLSNDYSLSKSEYSTFRIKNNLLIGETLLKAKKMATQNVHYSFLHYPIALLDDQYFFISVLSNELFVYEEGKIMSRYYLNMPENEPSESFIEEHKDLGFFELIETLKKNNIGWGITAIESSSDYLFMSISNKSTVIWDKKRSIQISSIYDSNLNLYSDLLLPGGVSNEHLGFYSADFLCAEKDLILEGTDKSLAKLVETLLEDDNPIVCQYFFKKNAIDILIEKYGI
ncbi:6-bladed beta-propeller [Bacteroides thetaiotaomicron]|jgi:hypothetical protein|uniref:6-bladed beta-propeller n=4 Tax=Bacteroides thetaiotaomicron TaxID=818 RepID=UPI0018A0A3EC|nr:6-bladed beta-propeller [Bacteroides thetaiotaomicron]MBV4087844.1 6-bladed beta-propeller [Bacteroides thetaiotaomicron]MBV4099679.1 6-bladed beta-propeller [Bacteroides thetaiotaomicron]MBV4135541.1 6-bladed beta-propeller [Bacteroides thetaiotaomicron]MCA6010039.1 6-bladed beta-propeller [Bacteroides thetaiotaomicron]MCS2521303.1 6-bladed beta-propeller [Bacteroides thetaiotaomicron]